MSQQELDELLRQLHSRLGAARSIDAADRQLLTTVLRDIEDVLGRRDAPAPNASGLEAFAAKFDAEHPALAGATAPAGGHARQSRNLTAGGPDGSAGSEVEDA